MKKILRLISIACSGHDSELLHKKDTGNTDTDQKTTDNDEKDTEGT